MAVQTSRKRSTSRSPRAVDKSASRGQRASRPSARVGRGKATPASADDLARAAQLLALTIEFIDSPEFRQPDAALSILQPVDSSPAELSAPAAGPAPTGMHYFGGVQQTALFSDAEETAAFRKMNFLKHEAARLRRGLRASAPRIALMDQIEATLSEAAAVRSQIIQANLRLVVSIAKSFLDPSQNLSELISDGNIALIRAVEKFDFARGFKFSTYGTYAIRRHLARMTFNARRRSRQFVSGDDIYFGALSSEPSDGRLGEHDVGRVRHSIGQLVSRLNEREQLLLRRRFGLGEFETRQTLKSIAAAMGICKERVRQIEARALDKLRQLAGRSLNEFV